MMNWKSLLSARRAGKQMATHAYRSIFEQDYDRIIFSQPFRRLQDKTQVHPLPEYDFVHTRLTHSLEVSSVGRTLGKQVGEQVVNRHADLTDFSFFDFGAIVAAAALVHDIGNPPFGHAGESAFSEFFLYHEVGKSLQQKVSVKEWNDLIRFEGNAQGFRILHQKQSGLTLTDATLGAFVKYPCSSTMQKREGRSQKKFGFFQSEKNEFEQLASSLALLPKGEGFVRHPLAFLVEAADDICYHLIDLEDACRLGLLSEEETIALFGLLLKDKMDVAKLKQSKSRDEKLGVLRALSIGQMIQECVPVFLDHEKAILDGKFDESLIEKIPSHEAVKQIGKISFDKIYHAKKVVELEAAGNAALPNLLSEFLQAALFVTEKKSSRKMSNIVRLMPDDSRARLLDENLSPYQVARLVLDFVSGLTDRYALSLHQRLRGDVS